MHVDLLCQFREQVWVAPGMEKAESYILGVICSRRLVPLGSRKATHEFGSIRECVSIVHAVECGVYAFVNPTCMRDSTEEKKKFWS